MLKTQTKKRSISHRVAFNKNMSFLPVLTCVVSLPIHRAIRACFRNSLIRQWTPARPFHQVAGNRRPCDCPSHQDFPMGRQVVPSALSVAAVCGAGGDGIGGGAAAACGGGSGNAE